MTFNRMTPIAIIFLLSGSTFSAVLQEPSARSDTSGNETGTDLERILEEIRGFAEEGSREAQRILGETYLEGRGVPVDEALAGKWIKKAAEQGDPVAQRLYGRMCLEGRGFPQDRKKAKKWIEKAAKGGDSTAQTGLGLMYLEGEIVPQDYRKAEKWFQSAAERGSSEAQYSLGLMYLRGEGIPRDYEKAKRWLGKIAERGHIEAQYALGAAYAESGGGEQEAIEAYKWLALYISASSNGKILFLAKAKDLRDSLAARMTAGQKEEAGKRADEWRAMNDAKPIVVAGSILKSKIIKNIQPVYPQLALRARISGWVVLAVTVDKVGDVEDVRVLSGHRLFAGAAADAVRQWKFSPIIIKGKPARVTSTLTMSFHVGNKR